MLVTLYNKTPNKVSTHYSGTLVVIPGTQSESFTTRGPDGEPNVITRSEPGQAVVGDKCRTALLEKGSDLYGKVTDDYGEACEMLGIETTHTRNVDSANLDKIAELEAKIVELKATIAPKSDEFLLKQFEVIDEHLTEPQVVGAIRVITAGEVVVTTRGRKADAQKLLKDLLV